MNKPFRVIPAGAALGLLAGLVIQLVEDWSVLTLPVWALGEGLRGLSLSGAGVIWPPGDWRCSCPLCP